MKNGFVTVASAVPTVKVADVAYNIGEIEKLMRQAEERGVEVVCFPELCVTGYSCQDLFGNRLLLEKSEEGLKQLLAATSGLDVIAIVGLPVQVDNGLLNCAVVIQQGEVLGIVPKTHLPNYNEFYEKRWFISATEALGREVALPGYSAVICSDPDIFVTSSGMKFGVEICEDVWAPVSPSASLTLSGADIMFNLSASDDLIGKHAYLKSLLSMHSARFICGYVYSGCGFGESTQDVVYGGNSLIYENGHLLCEGERFALKPQLSVAQIDVERIRGERMRNSTYSNANPVTFVHMRMTNHLENKDVPFIREVNPLPFIPVGDEMKSSCEEILNIQTCGLIKRLDHTNSKKVVVGISGGLDSTLALLVCVRAFDRMGLDRKGIVGVTMPGFGTTDRTYSNAMSLMDNLGITVREISISRSVLQHFEDIGHDKDVHDVTYENSQARERTQILMDLSNQLGALVIGTGDLSELALGWATYNGDHMSMYGVNAGVPKTLIRYLVRYVAENDMDERSGAVLLDIIDTPISPELIPADNDGNIKQKTEDLVGPYELHDFFLYYFLRFGFGPAKIYMLAEKAFDGSNAAAGKYTGEVIKYWLKVFVRRFFNQQFKRSCLPDGPKVGSVSLSPRGDWRMPTDASATMWLSECDSL